MAAVAHLAGVALTRLPSVALAHIAAVAPAVPVALDGEAETVGNTGLGIISVVSIGVGWVGLFALWWFVFRDKSRSKRKKRSSGR
jgi:threonine dehydrogenase-like Zn-dependent dehydrogenase